MPGKDLPLPSLPPPLSEWQARVWSRLSRTESIRICCPCCMVTWRCSRADCMLRVLGTVFGTDTAYISLITGDVSAFPAKHPRGLLPLLYHPTLSLKQLCYPQSPVSIGFMSSHLPRVPAVLLARFVSHVPLLSLLFSPRLSVRARARVCCVCERALALMKTRVDGCVLRTCTGDMHVHRKGGLLGGRRVLFVSCLLHASKQEGGCDSASSLFQTPPSPLPRGGWVP